MRKILVVVDMQNDFITGALGSKEAEAIVPAVVKKLEEYSKNFYSSCICFTRDTHNEDYLSTEEGKNLPVEHCRYLSDGWQVADEVLDACRAGLIGVVDKKTFGSTELPELMREYTPEQIELIGLCTDICVVSNALLLKAFYPNTPIYVDAACCAGTSPEAHDAAIRTMESCQIHILNKGKEAWRA